MSPPLPQPADTGPSRPPRALRLAYAGGAALLARWLVPIVFPYVDPDPYLLRWLGFCLKNFPTWGQASTAVAYLVPYLLLGLAVYRYFGRLPAPVPGTGSDVPARGRPWLGRVLVLVSIAASVGFAYRNRFLADDAYISFRYARNLVEGAGLVYNPGERVEGYTNFLWVMLLAAGMTLKADPGVFAQGLGLACFAGMLALTYRLARLVLPHVHWALVTLLLVGTQFSVLSFATGGLETSLQTFLLVWSCWLVLSAHLRRRWRALELVELSFVLAAGMLTRMDFAVFGIVLSGAAVWSIYAAEPVASGRRPGVVMRKIGLLLLPATLLVSAWLLWKGYYYGTILPNTYYANRPGPGAVTVGLNYLWDFCRTYRYQLPSVVFLIGAVQLARQQHILLAAVVVITMWCGYLVRMGGGFIEFRFLVPVVPLFLLCVMWTVTRFSWSRRLYLPVFMAVWMGYGSLHHARTFGWVQDRAAPVAHLRWETRDARWAEAGQELHRLFGHDDVIIATTAAGILPYYARLTTIDMHGLADSTIARQGKIVSNRPGHKRLAGVDYLKRRGVNLVIGHPKVEPAAMLDELPAERFASCVQAADAAGVEARIVAIPITGRHVLLAWYLTPHPAIDRAIATFGWRTFLVPPREGARVYEAGMTS